MKVSDPLLSIDERSPTILATRSIQPILVPRPTACKWVESGAYLDQRMPSLNREAEMKNLIDAAIVFGISLILFYTLAFAQPRYAVTDLGDLQPVAVIDGPVVFGNLNGAPVVWEDGQVYELPHYSHGGRVNGVNNRGDAVGYVWYPWPDGVARVAAFWYPDGTVTLLPGSGETEAWGLNMARTIAGQNLTDGQALRWRPGELEEHLPGVKPTFGRGVDDHHRVWGRIDVFLTAWNADGSIHHMGMSPEGPRC
jgi:hypothetical protein